MEEFFLKLGLMTQKNHTELIQAVDGLRMSIDALTKEIARLNSAVVESHTDLSDKISALADATKNFSAHVTENFSKVEAAQNDSDKKILTITKTTSDNQAALEKNFSALTTTTNSAHVTLAEKISTLANQTAGDNRALKEYLENLEELLRLMAANQVMNLVEK